MIHPLESILIVEDSDADFAVECKCLEKFLDNKVAITRCTSIKELEEKFLCAEHDAVILDLNLDDSWGIDTFHSAKAIVQENSPIIIVSGYTDMDIALLAISEGAQDFVCKDNLASRNLVQTIRCSIVRHRSHR